MNNISIAVALALLPLVAQPANAEWVRADSVITPPRNIQNEMKSQLCGDAEGQLS